MDERTSLFLTVLGGSGFFALLGALFGAVTGWVHASSGHCSGTALGLGVVRAYGRLSPSPLSDPLRGALVCGVDGSSLGAVVGLLLVLVAAWYAPEGWQYLQPVGLAGVLITLFALGVGLFACLLIHLGIRAVAGLFFGGVATGLVGLFWRGTDGLLLGLLTGAVVGVFLLWLWRAWFEKG